jgi:hypothetical protein
MSPVWGYDHVFNKNGVLSPFYFLYKTRKKKSYATNYSLPSKRLRYSEGNLEHFNKKMKKPEKATFLWLRLLALKLFQF